MCGIAGYVQRLPPPDGTIERMIDRLAHRGPDGSGVWRGQRNGWTITLGHRRLAIIDLAGGKQPLGNEDGSAQITYNGELYNFQLLRAELEKQGHHFATRSDTEVIVHHCEQHGDAALDQLNGMFAFAVWNSNTGKLLLARDRAGIKPLYYAPLPDGGLAFASELFALMAHPAVDRDLDPQGLASFFFADYAHPPLSLIRGVKKLQPGHRLIWSDGKLDEPQPFWQLNSSSATTRSAGELPKILFDKLDAAVQSQLVSDVPVGVFLSGGIDSSMVTALARRHLSDPPLTFSIRFEDPQFDESQFARAVAEHVGTRHIEQTFSEDDLLHTLDEALDCLDEPIADSSILPTFVLSKLAAKHVKVVLGGDGGDELWAGYPTYKAHRAARIYRLMPKFFRQNMIEPLVASMPVRHGYQSLEWKAKRFALRWDDQLCLRHLRWMSNVDLPDLKQALTQANYLPDLPKHLNGSDELNAILALDFSTYLPGSVLTKVDRASMAHGLEVRPPMLDNTMIDFAFSLPSDVKYSGGKLKSLLKLAAADVLPQEIIARPKKGFAVPLARWVNGRLQRRVQNVLDQSPLWDSGLLNRRVFSSWFHEHQTKSADRSRPLWALIVLDHWYRRTVCAASSSA